MATMTFLVASVTVSNVQPASAANLFVAPNGSPTNNGSADQPLDLATALSANSPARPGDTIWLRGGVYVGVYTSVLRGTADLPIVVRQYPGEWATLDGAGLPDAVLTANGEWTVFWGFEITNSDPQRLTSQTGPWPDGMRRGNGVLVRGPHLKFINLVFHDLLGGIGVTGAADDSLDTEVYGSLFFYNGWLGGSAAYGHGINSYSRGGIPGIRENILFSQFSHGIHIYGSSGIYVDNVTLEGNIAFNNGDISGNGLERDILLGGGISTRNPIVHQNYTFGGAHSVLGYGSGCTNGAVTNNYFVGWFPFLLQLCTPAMTGNTLYGLGASTNGYVAVPSGSLPALYPQNTYHYQRPTTDVVAVRPNAYEPGRGHVVIYNWTGQSVVTVDLAPLGLSAGAGYEIRDAQNFFGAPVAAGVYDGNPVVLPMVGLTRALPIGNVPVVPQHTGSDFGVFVVLPTDGGPVIEPPSVVATPTIDPAGGVFSGPVMVALASTTPGAVIRFTTNGTSPTSTSPVYTGPFSVAVSSTVKARGFAVDMLQSTEASATFTLSMSTVATPTISPAAGTFTGPIAVTLASTTPGAAIRYTTNGASPTSASTLYTGPFTVSVSSIVKARGFAANMLDSAEASAGFTVTGTPPPGGLTKVLPLGDSMTYGLGMPQYGGYRIRLYHQLLAAGIQIDYVGSIASGPSNLPDQSHDGHNGWTVEELDAEMGGWLNSYQPDVILLMAGTNDILRGQPSPEGDLATLIDHLFVYRPNATVVVASIAPLANPTLNAKVASFNATIPAIVTQRFQAGRKIYFANVNGALTVSDLTSDAIHLNAAGYDKMADVWLATLLPLLATGQPSTVATPTISPAGGNFTGPVTVTLASTTAGAAIRYTTDGTSPTSTSPLYTNPFSVAANSTVKARGFAADLADSAEASAAFTITVATPTISPTAGSFIGPVTVTLASTTAGAAIRYTTNGASPTSSSTLYTGPFSVAVSSTVKARGFAANMLDSAEATAAFTITLPTVATPTISPAGGNFTGPVTVTLASATAGAAIRYTTNGTSPTSSSTLYTGPFSVGVSSTVKARGFATNMLDSAEASAAFTITVATPTISPAGGSFIGPVTVTLASTTAGAAIRYTTNGASPTIGSTPYTGPFTVSVSSTVKARGFAANMVDSAEASAAFTITVATPTISPAGGNFTGPATVTLATTTAGAAIRYTTNGASPTSGSTLYTGPFTVSVSSTVKARGFAANMLESAEASAAFTITLPTVATPTISPAGGSFTGPVTVTLASTTAGAAIRFTTNGTAPTSASPLYTAPFNVAVSGTVKARAFAANMVDSAEASAAFTVTAAVPPGGPIKIMPFGDSITYGFGMPQYGGYRIRLYQQLVAAAVNVDFVGYMSSGPSDLPDKDNEGHGGWTVDELDTGMGLWLNFHQPGVILVMAGTNDITKGQPSPEGDLATLIDHLFVYRPDATVVVASIAPLADPALNAKAAVFNAAIPAIVDQRFQAGRKVYFANVNAALSLSDLSSDGIHLNAAGYDKVADVWLATLLPLLATGQPSTVATPTISPAGGNFTGPVTVTLASTTAGAAIRYTTNGASPTSSSTLYTGPFSVAVSSTVKARGFAANMLDSAEATAAFTITLPTVATPTISPAGGNFTGPVTVTLASTTAGATIRYTTNGASPTSSSALYTGPFSVAVSGTVKARGFAANMLDSAEASATFTITPGVPPSGTDVTVKLEPEQGVLVLPMSIGNNWEASGGKFLGNGVSNSGSSTLSFTVPTAGVYYMWLRLVSFGPDSMKFSVDGGPDHLHLTPQALWKSSLQWVRLLGAPGTPNANQRVAFDLAAGNHTIRIQTVQASTRLDVVLITNQPDFVPSGLGGATTTVATPTISPAGGNFTGAVTVTLASTTAGAAIRYTTNGASPTSSSTLYTGPFSVALSSTVKARGFATNMLDSAEASAAFTITVGTPTVATPTISPAGGNFTGPVTVTLASTTAGAAIRYTTNGAAPTSSSTLYTGPFSVAASSTVKARGFAANMLDSAEASAAFTITVATPTVVTPTISPTGGSFTEPATVTLASTTAGAAIRYTTNGASPTSSSTLYTGPFSVAVSGTVKARGFAANMLDSAEASATFTITPGVPPSGTDVTVRLEAEQGVLVLPMSIGNNWEASGGKFLGNGSTNSGSATLSFTVPTAGVYYIWLRLVSFGPDSMKFSVDGGPDHLHLTPQALWKSSLQWVKLLGAPGTPNAGQRVAFDLAAGNHTIRIKTVQASTRLDVVLITNQPGFVP